MGDVSGGDGAAAGSVGGRLMLSGGSASQALPVSEWTAVEAKQRQRLARVEAKLRRLRQRLEEEAKAFVVGSNGSAGAAGVGGAVVGGVLERLSFLQAERGVHVDRLVVEPAAPMMPRPQPPGEGGCRRSPAWQWWRPLLAGAEWNADLAAAGGAAITGRVVRRSRRGGVGGRTTSTAMASWKPNENGRAL